MNIVILGAGEVGSYLATTLSEEEHNVVIVDKNPQALEKVSQKADIAVKHGSGTDWKLLEELLDHNPHIFIALSSDDETNLVACSIAKNLGYPTTVARIRQNTFLDRFRLDFARLFFVDHFIGTELIVAHDLLKSISHPGNLAVESFAHGSVQMRTILVPSHWPYFKKNLSELPLPKNLLVGLIRRKSFQESQIRPKEKIIFPKGQDYILPGDEVTIIGEVDEMMQLYHFFGIPYKKVSSVTIAGGSSIALHLCRLLIESHIHVTIIEKEEKTCKMIAEQFPEAIVLHQDASDIHFLIEEQMFRSDFFLCCTRSNETNILIAALAKQAGCKEVLTLISDESYSTLLRRLGILFSLSEKVSIAHRIHAILHQGSISSISSLYHNQAKIIEMKVSSDSEVVGIPIRNLKNHLPLHFLIALIENRGRITVAKGDHILTPGDTIIVICSPEHIQELEKIF